MIVPPKLQDLPETITSESSASSSAGDNGDGHHASPSSSPSSGSPSNPEEEPENVGGNELDLPAAGEWEDRVLPGRLSNIRKAPKDLPAGFRFRAALHHEVADSVPSISGYKGLEEMIREYHIPRTILVRTSGQNERACSVSQTGWIPVLQAGFDAADTQQHKVHRGLYAVVCETRGTDQGDSVQVAVLVPAVSKLKRSEVFIFVRDTQTERVSNDLAARLSEWRTPNAHVNYPQLLPRDTDLKNRLLEHERRENLVDLEALVTPELLAVFRFVDVANLFTEGIFFSYGRNCSRAESYAFFCAGEMSSILERQRQRAQGSRGRASGSAQPRQTRFDERPPPAPQSRGSSHWGSSSSSRPRADHRAEAAAPGACRRAREETESEEDEVPLARRRTSGGTQPAQAARPVTVRSPNAPSVTVRAAVEPTSASASMSGPRIAYPEGFSYVGQSVSLPWCKACTTLCPPQILAAEKASLVDDVNRLQGSEMANRAAAVESQADEIANRINELKEELERAHAERESGIQATKDEAARAEERAKRAEDERDHAQTELSSLRFQVTEADKNLSTTEEALNALKASHARSVGIARAQGAEWLVGSSTFQDAVAVALANMTTEIYNEIRGKVLHHRPDFPIRELVFFDEEELDEQGKSLAPLADTTVRLRWDVNEEGVPVWPPSVLEDGEDPVGLPSFDAWVEGAPVAEQEPSSTPPNSQPAVVPASSPVSAPALEPAARSPPAHSSAASADTSMPVDLTDD
ncbi:hypothetical protein SLEP1_g44806 [Rubroshorea leprosula]|uniref:Uncharacterized protein n=1 Tax=Rubroshorea leprosula TaxID=152421 RepID=A0AAV5LHD6_9ROSI|nr:hypothetical protein SLEP1_g44806 [Rubroshorea leprosula]